MNKRVFLAQLKLELRGLPIRQIEDVLSDYDHYFHEATEGGMTEEEAIETIGDPKTVAEEIRKNIRTNDSTNIIVGIGLLLFNFIFVLGPFLGLVGLFFGLLVMSGAFIISPILAIVSVLFGISLIFNFFVSLVLAGIGLLLLPMLIKGGKAGFELVEKYVRWNMSHFREAGF